MRKSSDIENLLSISMRQWAATLVHKKSLEVAKRLDAYFARADSLGFSKDRATEILDEEARILAASPNSLDALDRASRRLAR